MWPGGVLLSVTLLSTLFLMPETENLKNANPIVTPTHIKPEWYFLIFYAILRAVPSKVGRLVIIFLSIFVMVALLLVAKNYYISVIGTGIASLFVTVCLILGLLRGKPVEEPYITYSLILSLVYFGLTAAMMAF